MKSEFEALKNFGVLADDDLAQVTGGVDVLPAEYTVPGNSNNVQPAVPGSGYSAQPGSADSFQSQTEIDKYNQMYAEMMDQYNSTVKPI